MMEVLVCGYERGGTTLLSEILRNNEYESGFECGVLLCETPRSFPTLQPYWDMLLKGWGINESQRQSLLTDSFQEFYQRLCKISFPMHSGKFFDKTPIYMSELGKCLHKAPFMKKAIVIHRDPRAVFLSMAKRMSPSIPVNEAIDKNYKILHARYLDYFYGSISHLENENVLFVPFEELVSREDAWMKTIGFFLTGQELKKRTQMSRFVNVTSNNMDLSKIVEFDQFIDTKLQNRILSDLQLASLFFAGPIERASFSDLWLSKTFEIKKLLSQFDIFDRSLTIEGHYFEPFSYLLKNEDVFKARVNPVRHFANSGIREGRRGF